METSPSPTPPTLVAAAPLAEASDLASYKPTAQDMQLAGLLFELEGRSLEEVADAAGISRSTVDRIRSSPVRCAWILQKAAEVTRLRGLQVFAHVARQAASSENPAWAKLFLEHFSATSKPAAQTTVNTQFNVVTSMSDDELKSFLAQTSRRVLGDK